MKPLYLFLVAFLAVASYGQQTISGMVVDAKNKPIVGANVYIEGTYDGSSSDEQGNFSFTTTASGNQTLVISFLTYETLKLAIDVATYKNGTRPIENGP